MPRKYIKKEPRKWLKTCPVCHNEFEGHFHSIKCRGCKLKEKTEFSRYKRAGISTSTVGAIQELLVSVDLMEKGYHVFRALSPSCPCDLFALKDGKAFDIEVRTAYRKQDGSFSKNYHRLTNPPKYFAWVVREINSETDTIIYEPSLI